MINEWKSEHNIGVIKFISKREQTRAKYFRDLKLLLNIQIYIRDVIYKY